jgi:hypothetical protein
VDRRQFINKSLITASSALLASQAYSMDLSGAPPQSVPSAIPSAAIGNARFPHDFLRGMATAAYQVEEHGKRTGKASRFGIASRTLLAR